MEEHTQAYSVIGNVLGEALIASGPPKPNSVEGQPHEPPLPPPEGPPPEYGNEADHNPMALEQLPEVPEPAKPDEPTFDEFLGANLP